MLLCVGWDHGLFLCDFPSRIVILKDDFIKLDSFFSTCIKHEFFIHIALAVKFSFSFVNFLTSPLIRFRRFVGFKSHENEREGFLIL